MPVLLAILLWTVPAALAPAQANRGAVNNDAFTSFWSQFRQAVVDGKKEAVADLTKLPFLMDGASNNRAAFLRKYDSLFTTAIRTCFRNAKPVRETDAYSVFCGEQIFVFSQSGGRYLFSDIGVND